MEPKKDFDYDEFYEFMCHLSGVDYAVQLLQQTHTRNELDRLDSLEFAVSSLPCYTDVHHMLESIKEL